MKEWLSSWLSELHRVHLKPKGFKKSRRTFSRDKGTYWERFNFQGSSQNYAGVAHWRFYLNVGVEFKNLEPRRYWSLFPHTHWSERADRLVANTPGHWEYNLSTDRATLAEDMVALMMSASHYVANRIDVIHKEYVESENQRLERLHV
jgi:hypothetical protein